MGHEQRATIHDSGIADNEFSPALLAYAGMAYHFSRSAKEHSAALRAFDIEFFAFRLVVGSQDFESPLELPLEDLQLNKA